MWTAEKFTKGQAWIDLLILAHYDEGSGYHNGVLTEYHRGFVDVSIKYLAERWKWDWRTVKSFLKTLEEDDMISVKSYGKGTNILIKNYNKYQREVKMPKHRKGEFTDEEYEAIEDIPDELGNFAPRE